MAEKMGTSASRHVSEATEPKRGGKTEGVAAASHDEEVSAEHEKTSNAEPESADGHSAEKAKPTSADVKSAKSDEAKDPKGKEAKTPKGKGAKTPKSKEAKHSKGDEAKDAQRKEAEDSKGDEAKDAKGKEAEDSKSDDAKDSAASAVEGNASGGKTPAKKGGSGTPAHGSKNKRKSTGGMSERGKKVNKKKSQVLTHLGAQAGDFYLARMKGHPAWPSVICDEDMLPAALLTSRGVSSKRPDGTYREDYADGGKRVNERTFPVMFLGTNEFAWIVNTDLVNLDVESIELNPTKARPKKLEEAYKTAAEKHDLKWFKKMLGEHEAALLADEEEKPVESGKTSKSKKKDKDAMEDSDTNDDESMEDEDDDEPEPETKSKSKKRKKDVDSDGEDTKASDARFSWLPAKTPKRRASAKNGTPKTKTPNSKKANGSTKKSASKSASKVTPSSKKGKSKASSSKKSAKKDKDEEDEDAEDESSAEEEDPSPEVLRERKENQIRLLRHQLQRAFLMRDQAPKEEDMKKSSEDLARLETYQTLEGSIIRATKVNKVLKGIVRLATIPKDEEFRFRHRAFQLLQAWNQSTDDVHVEGGANGTSKGGAGEAKADAMSDDGEEVTAIMEDDVEAPDVAEVEVDDEGKDIDAMETIEGAMGLEVGDVVDVPGGMYGTVRFIGNVSGKSGLFAGVELGHEYAQRGKNDGDVEGVRYFTTSVPRSGIFLPITRATKRASPGSGSGSAPAPFPPTPPAPSVGAPAVASRYARPPSALNDYASPAQTVPKFSQSVGPGRAPSPVFKPKRPSLPRPESPLRRAPTLVSTPSARPAANLQVASRHGASRFAPSPVPGKAGSTLRVKRLSSSYAGEPGKKSNAAPASAETGKRSVGGSRTHSSLDHRSSFGFESAETEGGRIGVARTSGGSRHSSAHVSKTPREWSEAGGDDDAIGLRLKLDERDRQLKEQAASLTEMERNLAELQSLMGSSQPQSPGPGRARSGGIPADDGDGGQLRAMLREKNEKIALLTDEFDAHRADFRSTIDTLELASTETERVYEKRVEELLQEIRELQDRNEDVEIVARQLKQLEELVAELEDGLEDARRGEAEARGEVEFLRGEVERGRSELRREREKAAAALKGAGAAVDGGGGGGGGGGAAGGVRRNAEGSKEVEQRDDEIRGLKAIIHSLSRDAVAADLASPTHDAYGPSSSNTTQLTQELSEERVARDMLEREMKDLRGLVDRKAHRENELERELDSLRHRMRSNGTGPPQQPQPQQQQHRASADSQQTMTQAHQKRDASNVKGSPAAANHPRHHQTWKEHASSAAGAGPGAGSGSSGNRSAQIYTLNNESSENCSSDDADSSALWCDVCETGGHDILTCTNMFDSNGQPRPTSSARQQAPHLLPTTSEAHHGSPSAGAAATPPSQQQQPPQRTRIGRDIVMEGFKQLTSSASASPRVTKETAMLTPTAIAAAAVVPPPLSPRRAAAATPSTTLQNPSGAEMGLVGAKTSGVIDPTKWCALCERDGHDSVSCPFEDGL
ncbi:MAG: hypothetical protein M1826_004423 [Phylliscum demangeonii]|nr:MAG: hypothetical protein M1826_004423 [Phylliscum demangeonii]